VEKKGTLIAFLVLWTTSVSLAQSPVPERAVRASDNGGVVLQWAFRNLHVQGDAEDPNQDYLRDSIDVFLIVEGKQKSQFFLGSILGKEAVESDRDPSNANDLGGFRCYWMGQEALYQIRRDSTQVIVERSYLDEGDQGVTHSTPELVYKIIVPAGVRLSVAPSVQLGVPAYSRLLRVEMPPLFGQDVFFVQSRLMEASDVDGYYGKKTDQAVRQYQAKHDLEVDGIVGPKTWKSLADRFSGL
jgi:peptidoglycan hydrolase-like protein with peptidoglycan-binding domain